uniref:protein-glutamine gamma-glutamyltransferase n=1 Tax=Chelonoidis abingdonii TaxID=106734 RepID=A0A8C0QSN2_CHEAB
PEGLQKATTDALDWHPKANTSAHHTDRYTHAELTVRRGQVFIITLWFNRPWQTGDNLAFVTEIGDDVHIANEDARQEYVLDENGIIFIGNANYIEARGWYYGQFQDDILNICLTMLDLSLYCRQDPVTDMFRRGDPKYVGRVISSMINGNDNDNGVLEGSWNDNFAEHENPSRWNGSVVILRKWRQENYKSVQYGQCWVFAGVMCTVMRCLGIPTRLISNFNSAHDADGNLSIDKYYDSAGKSLNIGRDSSWDYHVWNEVWFSRRDLGTPYNGWQVLDSTPQEQSKGIFQCGPASVRAIKEGDVDLDYDTLFVFTEVNADCNQWIVYKDGTRKKVYCDTERIGKAISTKAVGSNSRVDVTNNYKYPEGSHEEREVYKKACAKARGSNLTERLSEAPNEGSSETVRKPEVSGVFKLVEPPVFGKDINLILILTNLSSEYKPVKVNLSASTILLILSKYVCISEKQIQLKISYAQYEKSLTDAKKILVTALCEVMHTQEAKMLVEKTITLETPTIFIKVLTPVVKTQPFALQVVIANHLYEPVTECVLTVEGSRLLKEQLTLRPQERTSITFQIIPFKSGQRQLQVNFKSNKFRDLKGYKTLMVAPSSGF